MRRRLDLPMLSIILALAWPTMLEQLMQTAVQYIDTAMVGTLGTRATAAVGATATVNWLVNSTVSALGVGFLTYISQAIGAGKAERARRASGQSVLAAAVVGLLLTAVTTGLSSRIPGWMRADPAIRDLAARYFLITYLPMLFRTASNLFGMVLRAAGDTRTPMRVGLAVNLINLVLNFFLIYPSRTVLLGGLALPVPGAGWGVEGAAAASALSYVFGGVAVGAALWRHPVVSPRGESLLPDRNILRPCLRVALPNMFHRFATSFGYVAFASMINSLGETAAAAHTIANTVESAFYIPGWGMQTAAATLAGNACGAGDRERLRRLTGDLLPLEACLMLVSGGLLFAFAPQLVGIFSRDASVIVLGTTVLRMVAVSEPFYGVPVVLEGVMQGMGKTLPPLLYNAAGMWGVRIVGTYLCTQKLGLGLVSAWGCMIGHNMLLFVLFTAHMLVWNRREKSRQA